MPAGLFQALDLGSICELSLISGRERRRRPVRRAQKPSTVTTRGSKTRPVCAVSAPGSRAERPLSATGWREHSSCWARRHTLARAASLGLLLCRAAVSSQGQLWDS